MNNYFNFIGRICRNLVLKDAGNNKILDVTLAINRTFKNANGEYDTDFIKCKAFNVIAENTAKYRQVGDLVSISGRVQTGSYTNQEEKKVYTTDFIIEKIQLLVANTKKEETKKSTGEENETVENTDDPYESFGLEHANDLPFE